MNQLVLKMYVLQLLSKGFHKLQGFKNSGFAEMKNRFEKEEVAECSVCQFVKSNCLIGFDWGDAWFGASWGNSKWISTSSDKLPQILRIHHRLGKGFT